MPLKRYGNRDEMPTEWEQEVAEIYVNYREIFRPNLNIKTALVHVFLFLLATSIISMILNYMFISIGLFNLLPSFMLEINSKYPMLSMIGLYTVMLCLGIILCLKSIIIGIIKMYQHYAPNVIRRRCLFKPTCSEYTIIALRKYGLIMGLYKSYIRLFYRCRGNIYMIDYP